MGRGPHVQTSELVRSGAGTRWIVNIDRERYLGPRSLIVVDVQLDVMNPRPEKDRNGNYIDSIENPVGLGMFGYWAVDVAAAGDGQIAVLHSQWSSQVMEHYGVVRTHDVDTLDLAIAPWQWVAGTIQNGRFSELVHHDGATWVLGDSPADAEDPPHWWPTLWGFGPGENYPSSEASFPKVGHVDQDARRGLAVRDDGVMVLALQHMLVGLDADGKLLWHIDAAHVDPNAGASATPDASNFADAVIDADGADGAMFVGSVAMPAFACDRVAWAGRVSW